MHEHRHREAFVNKLEQRFNEALGEFRFFLKIGQTPPRVDNVGEHSSCEVETERMNLDLERFFDKGNGPVDHVVIDKGLDQAFLNTALL